MCRNILLLDEPTNHMGNYFASCPAIHNSLTNYVVPVADLDSVIWLEGFLQRQSIPMLVVSHDREFLDRVCNKITEVEDGRTVSYTGNYSTYLEQRKARLAQWRERYEKQQRYFREEEAYIRKAHGDPSLAQTARSRESALQKLRNGEDCISPPPRDRKFRFRFPPAPRCGEGLVECAGVGHGYGEGKYKVLFDGVDLLVERGDRIGFIGPNGSGNGRWRWSGLFATSLPSTVLCTGKSTLMRLLMKLEEPQRGFCEYGSGSVRANYYAQNQADALDLSLTVLETAQQHCPNDMAPADVRTLLGQFMFKGDDVYKKVGVLSGGEKARVALCKMMLQPANLLLLDEVSGTSFCCLFRS
jgi:ATP-binding cassette subfamily F protein 3